MEDDRSFVGVVGSLVLIIVVAVCFIVDQSERADARAAWALFKIAHHCEIVGRGDAQRAFGVTTDGELALTETDPTESWRCDDGMTYTKERGF